MLGVDGRSTRTESETLLEPGSTVLLFADGLVERRDADLDAGVQRLRDVAAEFARRPLADLCDGLVHQLVEGHPEDDVALVAIRLRGSTDG